MPTDPIVILYPPQTSLGGAAPGTPAKVAQPLARQFVAYGTKDNSHTVLGVMISVDATGAVDGKYRIASQTIPIKPDNTGVSHDRKNWLLKFQMPSKKRLNRHQRFLLVVFDSANLPNAVGNFPTNTVKDLRIDFTAHLKNSTGSKKKGKSLDSISETTFMGTETVTVPATGVTYSTDGFFAYGTLPANCIDIDTDQSELVDTSNDSTIVKIIWRSVDDSGFWVAFFDDIPTGMANADLSVVYTPNSDEEDVTNVGLSTAAMKK